MKPFLLIVGLAIWIAGIFVDGDPHGVLIVIGALMMTSTLFFKGNKGESH